MFFERISYTWSLMGASWDVLKRDKSMLIFPLLSGICCLIVMASFAVPIASFEPWEDSAAASTMDEVIFYGTLFLFYFFIYFIITFFNTAIIACAISRMAGGEPSVAGGFREAFARLPLIFGWACLAATVGVVLRIIESRSKTAGALVARFLGAAWSVLTFLVVPVFVVENKTPLAALKESTLLLRKTWGEQIIGNFSFGILFFVISLPGVALLFFGVFVGMGGAWTLGVSLMVAGVLYLILAALVQSALQSIFQAAVYMHAVGANDPRQGFPVKLLSGAMQPTE